MRKISIIFTSLFILLFSFGGVLAQTNTIQPYSDAPLCTQHDPTKYHGLWDYENGCHYDHTHGDNPHLVDDIFGTDIYNYMQGEISYPWHTAGENEEIKHKSYSWFVARDLPCQNQYGPGCIVAFRAFAHTDLHNVKATHHSALVEAMVCLKPEDGGDANSCGRFLVSGHQATGDLMINQIQVLDRQEPLGAPRPVMLHGDRLGAYDNATWYGVFYAWMRVATQTADMWGYYPIPNVPLPTTPDQLTFVRRNGNASKQQPHIVSVGVPPQILARGIFDLDKDGILNYNGFIDVHTGDINMCTEITDMCAPLIIDHIPAKAFQTIRPGYSGTQYRGLVYREWDVFFGRASSGWLQFPGFAP